MSSVENNKLLTDVELELMTILWSLKEGTVKDILEQLPPERTLAYTSVSTILRILEQKKGFLITRKQGRGHVYIPAHPKEYYESLTVKHMVSKVFAGTPSALVKQLLNSVDLDENELQEIKDLLKDN